MNANSTAGFGAALIFVVMLLLETSSVDAFRQHRSGRVTGIGCDGEDWKSCLDESMETIPDVLSFYGGKELHYAAAESGWWSWLWRTVMRAPPSPVSVDVPVSDPCEGFLECAEELASHLWDLTHFLYAQLQLLLTDPPTWSRQVEARFQEQPEQLRAIEHMIFGRFSWKCAVNVLIALGFALWYLRDHRKRLQAVLNWVPLVRQHNHECGTYCLRRRRSLFLGHSQCHFSVGCKEIDDLRLTFSESEEECFLRSPSNLGSKPKRRVHHKC